MKRFLLSAAVIVSFFSASETQAQTTATPRKAANSSVAPVARPAEPEWPAVDVWNSPATQSNWETAVTPTTLPADDPMMHSSGVQVAPGTSSSPYRGTSTDYNGRPVAKVKSKRPRSVAVESDDPMMHSSGVMLAPGMNTAPYRGVSTDYNGRPLRPATSPAAVAAQAPANPGAVAAQW